MEMSRLTPEGTAEPVSRDQILRRERGQENIHFPCSADHDNLTQLIYTLLYTMTIHIDTACKFDVVCLGVFIFPRNLADFSEIS